MILTFNFVQYKYTSKKTGREIFLGIFMFIIKKDISEAILRN